MTTNEEKQGIVQNFVESWEFFEQAVAINPADSSFIGSGLIARI